jgi:hypothetical protein
MSKKNFLIMSILIVFLASVSLTNAQEKPSEKKDTQTIVQHDDIQKCMDKIAADSTLSMQMMDKMMMHHKCNKECMMQMCKMKTEGEGMMKCGMMKHSMMCDSIETMEKPDHDSHHHKK